MRNSEAWDKIAQAFERVGNGAARSGLTRWGLCFATSKIGSWGVMQDQLEDYGPEGYDSGHFVGDLNYNKGFDRDGTEGGPWWWPPRGKGWREAAHERAIFAQLMAEVAREEEAGQTTEGGES